MCLLADFSIWSLEEKKTKFVAKSLYLFSSALEEITSKNVKFSLIKKYIIINTSIKFWYKQNFNMFSLNAT